LNRVSESFILVKLIFSRHFVGIKQFEVTHVLMPALKSIFMIFGIQTEALRITLFLGELFLKTRNDSHIHIILTARTGSCVLNLDFWSFSLLFLFLNLRFFFHWPADVNFFEELFYVFNAVLFDYIIQFLK
jgi:hypothetical protein